MKNDSVKNQEDLYSQLKDIDSSYFGSIKPLSAAQIVSLIIPTGTVGAGPCY